MESLELMNAITSPPHAITRMRHETRRRLLTVAEVERITPLMQRIRLTAPDLDDFTSSAPDDHVKLFFPEKPDQPDGALVMRDYTPRRFDPITRMLTLDFALHEAGPATAWALGAKPGDTLQIGGPRGSMIVTDDFDWYLLIGDETALPAIGRRIEELRPGVPVISIALIDSAAERQHFSTSAAWTPLWVERRGREGDDTALIQAALAEVQLPAGDGYVWIAAEAMTARALRRTMAETRGQPEAWMKASGYWVQGEPGAHE
jgi:NADPH-dependent ferric siderophore reductase